jgi:ribonucleoside-diphosphate reductase alpha chain
MTQHRAGYTQSFTIGGSDFYLTANSHQADGSLGEVFAQFGKQGSTLGGLMDVISILISVGLQHGVPLETFVAKLSNMRFEPMGFTNDPDVPTATSVVDYIARKLAIDFLAPEQRAELGIYTANEEARQLEKGEYQPKPSGWTQ